VRRIVHDPKLRSTLDEYERFIWWKAGKLARTYEDRKDFEQVGREAVIKVFKAMEGELKVRSEKGYYLNSIENAMLDYYRMHYRRNYEVWVYDKENGLTRVKRYRYGGEWKARIQYHGDKLKRVALGYRAPRNFEDYLVKG
jgi:hypothetical protein